MARGRKPKLDEDLIEQICERVKRRMKTKEIAEELELYPTTICRWIREGEKAKSGIKRQLVDAIAQAKAELTSALSQHYVDAVFLTETVTDREVMTPDGNVVTLRTTVKVPPFVAEARRILALMHPDRWAETKHIKYEWKESLENIGLDPKKIEDGFFKDLENREGDDGNQVVIPLIENKTV